ncbi:PTS transporter subunit EIIC [Mycoplasmopsis pulmonis]|uniref:PTS transporter subunit EIIC n=1 Tax=Mycoplasmopsis pulmonis TaxID=2107 RepID=UPI002ACE0381|nr:PTS transporter subunit EIIC [Mycoplasmopsis pulmonis]MDZ7293318.1 PTS transporter subunit EIIC [Mycoplasmopsis pulmonis]
MTKSKEIIKKWDFKNHINKLLSSLQLLGKSLMLPIAVLPIAALLLRIGSLIQDPLANGSIGLSEAQIMTGKIIASIGDIVFSNLALIFAVGISFGLAKDHRGEAALVGLIVWFGLNTLLKEGFLASNIWKNVLVSEELENKTRLLYFLKNDKPTYQLDAGVFGGIVVGVLTALIYNRYKDVKLHPALSFFGGRRFVPMLGLAMVLPLGLIFAIVWPWLQYGLISIGQGLTSSNGFLKGFYGGIYAFFNRLVQPFGLHHILNTFVWFQLPISGPNLQGQQMSVNGDIFAFNRGIIGSGVFTTGFFPLFLGGLPGAALAMIMTSDKSKRKQIMTFLGGALIVSWLTGIDEPLIFAFIFVSPLLYVLNAILTSFFYMITTWTSMSIGIGFSAGFIDYLVSFPTSWQIASHLGIMANPLWIWPIALLMGITYYFSFYFLIKKLKIATPGREEQLGIEVAGDKNIFGFKSLGKQKTNSEKTEDKYQIMAQNILDIIGFENIKTIEHCATRLRFILENNSPEKINDSAIKNLGARGVVRLGNQNYHIIIGTDVQFVYDHLIKLKSQKEQSGNNN